MTKDLLDPDKLEARLRRDLPRLADAIAVDGSARPADSPLSPAPGPADGSRPSYADELAPRHEHRARRARLLVAAAIVAVLAVGAAAILSSRSGSESGIATVPTEPNVAGHWTDIAPAPFDGALDVASVWTGTEVLLFGGWTPDQDGVPHAEQIAAAYNPATDTWRDLADPPGLVPAPAAVWVGDVAVVTGKTGGSVYDPATDTWRDLPPQPGPQEKWLAFTQPIWTADLLHGPPRPGNRLYIVGTFVDGDRMGTGIIAFDLDTWSWESAPRDFTFAYPTDPDPTPTQAVSTSAGIVIGQPDGSFDTFPDWRHILETNGRWDRPESLDEASVVVVDDQVYRIGLDRQGGSISVWRMQPTNGSDDEWKLLGSTTMSPADDQLTEGFQVIGGDDEIVILGLTGRDDRPPLEFDVGTTAWRDPVSAPGLSWTGRTAVWAGNQVFEWGGTKDDGPLADSSPSPLNTGRLWTPAARDTGAGESQQPPTTVSVEPTAATDASSPDDKPYDPSDPLTWLGDVTSEVSCAEGRQRVTTTFTNRGSTPLTFFWFTLAYAHPPDEGPDTITSAVPSKPLGPGAAEKVTATIEGSYVGEVIPSAGFTFSQGTLPDDPQVGGASTQFAPVALAGTC